MKVEGTSTLYYPPSMDTGFQDVFAPQLLINIYSTIRYHRILPSSSKLDSASTRFSPHEQGPRPPPNSTLYVCLQDVLGFWLSFLV